MLRSVTTRARRAVAVATLVALGVVALAAGPATGQEEGGGTGETTSTTTAPTTTTSTTAPPVTVVLEDGDFGVLPPGSGDPGTPGVPPPPPGEGDQLAPGGEAELPPELPVVILPDPTPGLNAALADIDVTRARRALEDAEPARRAAEAGLDEAYRRRVEVLAARRAAGERMLAAQSLVHDLAVNAVMFGDIAAIEPVLGVPSLDDLRDLELSDVAATKVHTDFDRARAGFRHAVAAELAADDELRRAERTTRVFRDEYLRLRTALDDAIRRAAEARRQLGPTILGPAYLERDDLVAWYRTYYPVDPPVAAIGDIIDAYLRVGAEEGVTGDIAFAQAILETGGFRSGHAQGFNFAGIGAYDGCAPVCAFHFADLEAGVRAHIHLLRAYADPGVTTAQLASRPDARVAPERVGVRGCCHRWTELTGIWATDPNYDRKVLGIYRLMVETARTRDRIDA